MGNSGQFKKGRSGNPGGRAKGAIEARTRLEKLLREKCKDRDVTKLDALLERVIEQAIAGEAMQQKLILDRIDPSTTKLDVQGAITAVVEKRFVGVKSA